ncbi:MAG: (Fe-S)-binding protein [Candidatus Krumholzibacteria bacterium]|nr:(Fe-S)-binding protein [Candidatus Krumholzibacteria bacterium]
MADPRAHSPITELNHLDELLRQCVQCGLCLPHCATWLATGNEVQSPRGRLLLLGEMIRSSGTETDTNATPNAFLQAFDECIGCRACETACPSGVPFSLLEYGQLRAAEIPPHRLDLPVPAVPGAVLRRMDQPGFLEFLSQVAGLVRGVLTLVAGKTWRRRLDRGPAGTGRLVRLLGSLPTSPRSDAELVRMLDGLCGRETQRRNGLPHDVALGASDNPSAGPRVAFFRGCANSGLLSDTSRRFRDLLSASGCRLEEPAAQDCCGALATHTGRPGRSADLRRRNRDVFAGALNEGTVIVAEAAGCSHELKEYGDEFRTGVVDAVVLLAGLDLPPLGSVPLRVAYHDPCHARHGQGIVDEPRMLLTAIPGLEIVEPIEPEVCCGSGGAWGLRYPELSDELGRRKAADLAATGADLVVTSNPGCLGQIADGLRVIAPDVPILPLTDLLWYAVLIRIDSTRS